MASPKPTCLAELVEMHDIFFVDQFGVLHDGQKPYDGAVKALSRLKKAGKTIVLLSNSGRRAKPNEERVLRLGFEPGSWDHFISSGEVAWRLIDGGKLPVPKAGGRCLLIAREGDRSAIDGLPWQTVDDSAGADLVLIAASEGDRLTLDDYRVLLAPAAAKRTPALCTNPDRIMLTAVGPRFGAGRIAELYEELGGSVMRIGKPFPEIYRAALVATGSPPPARVVCIGDSVEHDIAGAAAVGLRSALVRSGILADVPDAELPDIYAEEGAAPDYVIPTFAWR